MSVSSIAPSQLRELYLRGEAIDLIDVRTPVEFRTLHVEFARNIPLDQLSAAKVGQVRRGDNGSPVYVICKGGTRGAQACERLAREGMTNVVNVEGGTDACLQTALPMVRGKKSMSLERQVRIAAGSLTLIGALLGYFVHPGFVGLSAFVGGGLIFAGLTDNCAMGMLLAKMPWNRCSPTPDAC